jgi:hypothetical protein
VTERRGGIISSDGLSLFFYTCFCFLSEKTTRWGIVWKQPRQDRRNRPGGLDRGRGASTLLGILGEGTSTWSTGTFVCVIMWRLQQPHRAGGWKHVVREEQLTHTCGSVVTYQFWKSTTTVRRERTVSRTETHCLPGSITGQFGVYNWGHGRGSRGGWQKTDGMEQDNGSGQEEEVDDQQHPFQEDHVDVTNFLHHLNRRVPPPFRPES